MQLKIYFFLSLFFFNLSTNAAPAIELDSVKDRVLIGKSVSYFEDPTGKMGIVDVIQKDAFMQSKQNVPNFNLTRSTYWFKFSVAPSSKATEYLLEVNNPLIDKLHIYSVNAMGQFDKIEYGDTKIFNKRKYKFANFLVDIENKTNVPKDYYLVVRNHEPLQVPMYIGPREKVIDSNANSNIYITIFLTVILVMFLYNLFIYLSIRNITYLLYVAYIFCIGLTQICIRGEAFRLLWPNAIWLQQHGTYIFSALTGITSIMFFISFIKEANISKGQLKWLRIIMYAYALSLLLSLFGVYIIGYLLLQVLALLAVGLVLSACYKASRRGVPSANYYFIAWMVFIIGIIFFVLKDYDVIPYSIYSVYTMPAGSAIEVLLLSFALANRIKILQRDKEANQQAAIQAVYENERILSEQNETLDKLVKERTTDLEKAMVNLKRSEVELVNKEKMSSLGILTAGIAHEINNPINFVTSSISPLKRDIAEILDLLKGYASIDPKEINVEKLNALIVSYNKRDVPYLLEEIGMLLNGIEEGANRTATIVKGLQKFSRMDDNVFKDADLIEGLDNTIVLLNNQLKSGVELVKKYQEIPLVYCSIGRLNQVFLNVLTNAIHAVLDSTKPHKQIIIRTQLEGDYVQIEIEDNGIGISEEIKNKIFDPFFTTKEVGRGTGLGLAISLGIIEDHNGKFEFSSVPEVGTNIKIILPLRKAMFEKP
jgi:two-component system, NtrC family, sensor kinase